MSFNRMSRIEAAKRRIEDVPEYIRDDIGEAYAWAQFVLQRELINPITNRFRLDVFGDAHGVRCSISQPSWNADSTGPQCESGAQAIVEAVCYFLEGC